MFDFFKKKKPVTEDVPQEKKYYGYGGDNSFVVITDRGITVIGAENIIEAIQKTQGKVESAFTFSAYKMAMGGDPFPFLKSSPNLEVVK